MRIAFVSIPHFRCEVEVLRVPGLAHHPLVVGDADEPRRVLDCTRAAAACGVRTGMAMRQALGLCPEAVLLPPDPVLYRNRWEDVLDCLETISPEVEDADFGRAYLNTDGLILHYGEENVLLTHIRDAIHAASGLKASVGLATGKFPACVAAVAGSVTIPAGEESAFLAPHSLDLLPVVPEQRDRLRLFGFETIGEVAALTLPELQSQFGVEGRRLWRLANGIDDDPLRPRPQRERIEAALNFEEPVAGIDVMVMAVKQLLSQLGPALRDRAARELVLQAQLEVGRGWERRLVLREAVSERDRLLFVLRAALEHAPPPSAITGMSLRMSGLAGEMGRQLSLGERARQRRQLEEAIRQLRTRYGYSPIYNCVDVEPWSVIPEHRQILVESDA